MKKLGKLTLGELKEQVRFLNVEEIEKLKGGTTKDQYGNVVYSNDEFNDALANGTWTGGYVGSTGYISRPITVFNLGSTQKGSYYNDVGSWMDNQQQGLGDQLAAQGLGLIPGIAQMTSYQAQCYTNTCWRIAESLYNSNLGSSPVYQIYDENDQTLSIYNASSGSKVGTWDIHL